MSYIAVLSTDSKAKEQINKFLGDETVIEVSLGLKPSLKYQHARLENLSKIYNKIIPLRGCVELLVVSDDIGCGLTRDVVNLANKIGIRTACISDCYIESNLKEGWDYHITDCIFCSSENDFKKENARERGFSKVFFTGVKSKTCSFTKKIACDIGLPLTKKVVLVSDDDFSNDLLTLLLEEVDEELVFATCADVSSSSDRIFKLVPEALAIISKFVKYSLKCSIEEIVLNSRSDKETGFGPVSLNLNKLSHQGLHSFYLEDFDNSFSDIYSMSKSDVISISNSFDKPNYKTLGIYIKKGDNLLKTLYWYPKLMGASNHVIIRCGDESADIYSRFAFTETDVYSKLMDNLNRRGKVLYSLEHHFCSFPGVAALGDARSLSLLKDPVSLYFDGINGSALESRIRDSKLLSLAESSYVNECISLLKKSHITKYNHSCNFNPVLPGKNSSKVLVVDQRYGDKSISFSGAKEETFSQMLSDAINENPDSDIIVKIHPDALLAGYPSHFDKNDCEKENVYLFSTDCNSLALINKVDKVYVVSSQMGLEALLLDKEVISYGVSIYSGWGLTKDRVAMPRRQNITVSIEQLFYEIYVNNVNYIDPLSNSLVDALTFFKNFPSFLAEQYRTKSVFPESKELIYSEITGEYHYFDVNPSYKGLLDCSIEKLGENFSDCIVKKLDLDSVSELTYIASLRDFSHGNLDKGGLLEELFSGKEGLNNLFNATLLLGWHHLDVQLEICNWIIKKSTSKAMIKKTMERISKLEAMLALDLVG